MDRDSGTSDQSSPPTNLFSQSSLSSALERLCTTHREAFLSSSSSSSSHPSQLHLHFCLCLYITLSDPYRDLPSTTSAIHLRPGRPGSSAQLISDSVSSPRQYLRSQKSLGSFERRFSVPEPVTPLIADFDPGKIVHEGLPLIAFGPLDLLRKSWAHSHRSCPTASLSKQLLACSLPLAAQSICHSRNVHQHPRSQSSGVASSH